MSDRTSNRAKTERGPWLAPQRAFQSACVLLVTLMLAAGCASTPNRVSEQDQRQAAAQRDLGVDHLEQGRTAMAIRKLQLAAELDPYDPVTFLWLGEAFRRKGLLERAEQNLDLSLELNTSLSDFNRQETMMNLAALYIQMKRYAEAISISQTLIDDPIFSTPWRALTNRGWAEFQLRDYQGARESFERAVEFHPEYSPAHLNLGILAQRENRFVDAIGHYERALGSGRMSYDATAEANYRMAEIYVSLGKRVKAIGHFEIALDRSPYGRWGTQSKSYLELLR